MNALFFNWCSFCLLASKLQGLTFDLKETRETPSRMRYCFQSTDLSMNPCRRKTKALQRPSVCDQNNFPSTKAWNVFTKLLSRSVFRQKIRQIRLTKERFMLPMGYGSHVLSRETIVSITETVRKLHWSSFKFTSKTDTNN